MDQGLGHKGTYGILCLWLTHFNLLSIFLFRATAFKRGDGRGVFVLEKLGFTP